MELNWIAIFASAVAFQALGAIWWSPLLFGKRWMRAMGVTNNDLEFSGIPTGLAYLIAFATNLTTACAIAICAKTFGISGPIAGLALGAALWLGFCITTKLKSSIFEGRSMTVLAISEGHELVGYMLVGAIIGAF